MYPFPKLVVGDSPQLTNVPSAMINNKSKTFLTLYFILSYFFILTEHENETLKSPPRNQLAGKKYVLHQQIAVPILRLDIIAFLY